MQFCRLWQLRRDPGQTVLSYTENIQTAAAPYLDNREDNMIRVCISPNTAVLWHMKT